ncbi:asparagine synthase [Colletotrichum falcatum]|nr:asparagine synthase [Colletotrichum falcatum]
MCGAAVIVSLRGQDAETQGSVAAKTAELKTRLSKSLDLIAHRGPDARDIWIDPTATVGLAHNRLAIIDLSSEGTQPLHDDQGHIHAVINGEIYDHDRLRKECLNSGYSFKGKSDSEVVLALYQRYGAPEFLQHCRGEFSMVIYDDRSGEVFACRDRFGIKPLFYTIVKEELFFASEMKAFLAMGWKPEWGIESIAVGKTMIGGSTIFKGVSKIEPGFYMKVARDGAITHSQYWDLEFPTKTEVDNRSMEQMVEELRTELVNAVRLRLRADVPVGIYLSGGLDSSTVAGIAKKLIDEEGVTAGSQKISDRITTFTIAVNSDQGNSVYNEAAIASRTAKHLGVRQVTLNANEELLASTFEDSIWFCEQPIISLTISAKIALAKLARENGITVILTGEGADETFAGYPWMLPDLVLEPDHAQPNAPMNKDCDKLRDPVRDQAYSMWSKVHNPELPLHLKKIRPETWERMNHMTLPLFMDHSDGVHLLAPAIHAKHGVNTRIQSKLDCFNQDALEKVRTRWHPLNSSVYFNHKIWLPNVVIPQNGDRTEMSHSIEGRPPMLDHKVVELAARLPPSVKVGYFPQGSDLNSGDTVFSMHGDEQASIKFREKLILREAAKPFITEEIYSRPKHAFLASTKYPKEGPIHRVLKRLLTKDNVEALGFLDWEKIEGHMSKAFEDGSISQDFMPCLFAASFVTIGQQFGVAKASLESYY